MEVEIAKNTFPAAESILAEKPNAPNTYHVVLDAVHERRELDTQYAKRVYFRQIDLLTALSNEIAEKIHQKQFTFDPVRGEVTLNVSCFYQNGFFSELEGEVVHQFVRRHLEDDGWDDVVFRPATDGSGCATIRLGNKALKQVGHSYKETVVNPTVNA